MLLLPFETLNIQTHKSLVYVKESLKDVTAPRTTFYHWLGFNPTQRPFAGRIEDDHFEIVFYDKSIARMVCTGSVYKYESLTGIDMIIRPFTLLCFFYLVFYSAMIWSIYRLLSLIPQLLKHQPITTGDDLPWWASFLYIFAYLFLYFWHRYFANKAKKILREQLQK